MMTLRAYFWFAVFIKNNLVIFTACSCTEIALNYDI
jgi:hypothetical protein